MKQEKNRLQDKNWKIWGPYLSDRQWGTVREDYSEQGTAWEHISHDMARSKAYRWGEDGIAGISDQQQRLCFSFAFWNKKDTILKERFFGLTGNEGNHGEDVKELYYHLDATPTHSYLKMLYKYPQSAYPYERLVAENRNRTKADPEFELVDTGIFNEDKYFDIFFEYAKAGPEDILIQLTVHNRSADNADLDILPTLWFRNTWDYLPHHTKPVMLSGNDGCITVKDDELGDFVMVSEHVGDILFCDNETNCERLYGVKNTSIYPKDGINDYLISGKKDAVNPDGIGTKAAFHYEVSFLPHETKQFKLRLSKGEKKEDFKDFDTIIQQRKEEADDFYNEIQEQIKSDDEKLVQRQAFAGMIWSKQFYYFDVAQWLDGDQGHVPPPAQRKNGRNKEWRHLNNADIISMPDKWEYPWYAAWDLAFHCIPFSIIDSGFAKDQLLLLTKEWYMHPNGQFPAYEWAFGDVNPPVHAWATWRVYKIDKKNHGKGDLLFLESVFHKLLLNFTWWVNRKDAKGNNIFQGGFLGLDNIGVFDRSAPLPTGGYIEQADGTSWMAMYSLNLMRISLELAKVNPVYQDMATKFFEHFLYIAGAMSNMGMANDGLWDEEDQFFYDVLKFSDGSATKLKVRSMVGLIPLFAVEVLDDELLRALPEFTGRLKWFLDSRPDLASLVPRWQEKNQGEKHLLSLLRGHRMKKILKRMLDEGEFFSEFGIRALSKFHDTNPYQIVADGNVFSVKYTPGESDSGLFGGNSNWRGPIWMPVNYLIVESLQKFHQYYGEEFTVECPTGSGKFLTLNEVADEISQRLCNIFLRNQNTGYRPVFGKHTLMQEDLYFKDYLQFFEYFHGDNGRGVGASHQTGWTGLVAKLLQPKRQ